MRRKKNKKKRKVYLKSGSRHRRHTGRKKNLQWGGFFGRYDFAYAGRDIVNKVGKIAPGLIKQATSEIDKIARNRIYQVIKSGGAEVERALSKIIRGAIEDVYKTPFRLLGNFGKQQLNKIKKKILRKETIFVFFIYVYNKIKKFLNFYVLKIIFCCKLILILITHNRILFFRSKMPSKMFPLNNLFQ